MKVPKYFLDKWLEKYGYSEVPEQIPVAWDGDFVPLNSDEPILGRLYGTLDTIRREIKWYEFVPTDGEPFDPGDLAEISGKAIETVMKEIFPA